MESRSAPKVGGWHRAQLPGKTLLKSEAESCSSPHILAQRRCLICQVFRNMTCLPGEALGPFSSPYTLTQARWEVGVHR